MQPIWYELLFKGSESSERSNVKEYAMRGCIDVGWIKDKQKDKRIWVADIQNPLMHSHWWKTNA